MDRESVRLVVRTTLVLLTRIARRTRSQADDLMAGILQVNEDRLVETVLKLAVSPSQPPTEQQVVEALKAVGISV
jgi:hypothetical protein